MIHFLNGFRRATQRTHRKPIYQAHLKSWLGVSYHFSFLTFCHLVYSATIAQFAGTKKHKVINHKIMKTRKTIRFHASLTPFCVCFFLRYFGGIFPACAVPSIIAQLFLLVTVIAAVATKNTLPDIDYMSHESELIRLELGIGVGLWHTANAN